MSRKSRRALPVAAREAVVAAHGDVTQPTPLGNYVYALGVEPVVQRATLDVGAGELGSFVTVSGDPTPLPFRGTGAVIGNHVYWVGGVVAKSVLNSVKQAIMN